MTRELVGEPTGRERRERRGDAPHVAQRRQIGDVRIVGEHHHGCRRQDGGANGEAADERGEFRGTEAVHEHERRSGSQSEQDVVDAGVEGQGHRYEVRRWRSGRIGRPAPQRTEDTVEQLQVPGVRLENRLRPPGGSRRPGDEGRVGFVARGRHAREAHSTAIDHGGRGGGCQNVVQLGRRLSWVGGHEHRAGQPDPEHGEDELGSIGQLDHHRLTRLHPGGPQPCADAGGFDAGGARRDAPVHGVDQVITVGKRVLGQQLRQVACGHRHDPAGPRGTDPEHRMRRTVGPGCRGRRGGRVGERLRHAGPSTGVLSEACHRPGPLAEHNCIHYICLAHPTRVGEDEGSTR